MYSKILFVLLLFCLILNIPAAYSQEILTDEEAVRIALNNNYSINIAKNQARAAENNVTLGNAGILPELGANASYNISITDIEQRYFDGRSVDRNNAESKALTSGVSLNWTVFDGLRMFASLERLKSLRQTGELNFMMEIENNISLILSAYYNIVRLKEVLEVIRTSISISEERVKIARAEMDVGSGSGFELRQAQVDLNDDRSSLLREELNLNDARISLNRLLGRDVNLDFNVADTIILKNDLQYNDLFSSAGKNNNQLKAAQENSIVSALDLRIARSEYFPSIGLSAGYVFNRSEAETGLLQINRNSGFNYGITASFNIFNGLNTRRNIENARINIEISQLAYKEAQQLIESELTTSYKRYTNSREIVALEAENFSAAEANLSVALERLRLGNITPLEFREAQNDLLNAKSRLVAAQYEAKNTETELLRLSGLLITPVQDSLDRNNK